MFGLRCRFFTFWADLSLLHITESTHSRVMLTEAYIEALLVDEEMADLVGEALDAGLIDDELACIAWLLIATLCAY